MSGYLKNFRIWWWLALAPVSALGQVLPAGTTFEARFTAATGSAISRREDKVEATVISPIMLRGRIVIPPGAQVQGNVENVVQLGFGIKHQTASIQYHFTSIELHDGTAIPIEAQLIRIETAKERVSDQGVVLGVHPIANMSSA